jgi:hypothetical protein
VEAEGLGERRIMGLGIVIRRWRGVGKDGGVGGADWEGGIELIIRGGRGGCEGYEGTE